MSFDQSSEIKTVDALHDQEVTSVSLSGVMRDDDVWMVESADGADFLFESSDSDFIETIGFQNFERDQFPQFHMASAVDVSHASFAEQFENLVLSESTDWTIQFHGI